MIGKTMSSGSRTDGAAAAGAKVLRPGFTLIELLVVISIMSLLMSILLPSLSRARAQAKGVHCLARLKEFGNAIGAYENTSAGLLPPALWNPSSESLDTGASQPLSWNPERLPSRAYGWAELLFAFVYGEQVRVDADFPVQRNLERDRWQEYLVCKAVGDDGVNSGHYRVYLPAWSAGTWTLEEGGRYADATRADPRRSAGRERISPKLPLLGDANESSERGDGIGADECSFIDAGEANEAGSDGQRAGNRFSDRHFGGANYLFSDLHAAFSVRLREELARDFDLNGIVDIVAAP